MGWFNKKKRKKERKPMTRDEVEEKVRGIVMDVLSVPAEKVVDSAYFEIDLGADALDYVEIIINCEDSLDVSIPDNDGESLATFGKLVDYIARQLT